MTTRMLLAILLWLLLPAGALGQALTLSFTSSNGEYFALLAGVRENQCVGAYVVRSVVVSGAAITVDAEFVAPPPCFMPIPPQQHVYGSSSLGLLRAGVYEVTWRELPRESAPRVVAVGRLDTSLFGPVSALPVPIAPASALALGFILALSALIASHRAERRGALSRPAARSALPRTSACARRRYTVKSRSSPGAGCSR